MKPEEITRLANVEKKKSRDKRKEKRNEQGTKKEFNPFDWLDFVGTKKWMAKNLALSNKFYSYLALVFITCLLSGWIYLDSFYDATWALYAFFGSAALLMISTIFGLIYGYLKAKNSR